MNQHRLLMEYDITVFHNLYDFNIARTILRQLGPAVTVLGDIVCKHELQSHVGANLLHKHFDLDNGECVVRRWEGRGAHISPQPTDEASTQSMLPYLWQLAEGRDGLHFYPLEFESYDSHDAPAAKAALNVISQNTEFLHEFATRLWDFGLEDIFGIATLMSRSKIVLAPGETLVETTDWVNRVLTLAPIPEEELRGSDTTETLWIFSPPRLDAIELVQET